MKVILFCREEIHKFTPYSIKATETLQHYFAGDFRIQMIGSNIDAVQLRKVIAFWRPAGAIVSAASGYGVFTRRNLKQLPTVYLDPPTISASSFNVVQDNEMDARIAATELLSPGMKHYAFVGSQKHFWWSAERSKAFISGMRAANLPCSTFERKLPEGDYLKELALWLRNLPKPCGIFADNDVTALKVVEICSTLNIAIPEEIKLVGCDNNTDICEKSPIPISSVCPDYENAAMLCAKLIEERIADPSVAPRTVKYHASGLVRRTSSSSLTKCDRRVDSALKLINAKACDGITVSDIASELGCSARLLQMRFKATVGTPIKEFISDVRMERVLMMLKSGSTPIQDIAKACGYGTDAALRTAFRKRHFMSMNEWRRLYLDSH
ncbi:MAG: substrate-binding domain-containing protein [Kiritimatiellae bacterium]|nr:substrate-binding domain-containing protein [Kiritimatiellia bacterium]